MLGKEVIVTAINRQRFEKDFLKYFGYTLKEKQVFGIRKILDYWENSTYNDTRWLAYIIATAWHETGTRMEAVREGFSKNDEQAVYRVARLYDRGYIKRNYAVRHNNGNSYYGRGLVQITHGYNYAKWGYYDNPDKVLDIGVAVHILVKGMVDGMFTGVGLPKYFNNKKTSWKYARKIVNGLDKATQIAEYAKKFFKIIEGK